MIAVAIGLNLMIALFCFYVALRLWRMSKTLGAVADALVNWERNAHNILDPVVIPPAILRGQSGTTYLRQNYGLLQFQIRRLEQVMGVVGLLPMANRWLRVRGRRPRPRMAPLKRR